MSHDLLPVLERIAITLEKIADKPGYVKKPAGPKLTCPTCSKSEALRPDKINNDGTYYCWQKIGGCGGKGFKKEQLTFATMNDTQKLYQEKLITAADLPPIPNFTKEVFDKKTQEVDYKLATQEELLAKVITHSKHAWIYDDTPMTQDDLLLLNSVHRANGWAPSRLLKCSREEFSIKAYQAMIEDTTNFTVHTELAEHLLDLLKSIQPDQSAVDKLIDICSSTNDIPTFAQALSESALMRWLDDIS